MAFTFQALEGTNSVDTAQISITLTPTTPIITETNWAGDSSAQGIINIENDEADVDVSYFVSADWYPAAAVTPPENARLLAERLIITVTADPRRRRCPVIFGQSGRAYSAARCRQSAGGRRG